MTESPGPRDPFYLSHSHNDCFSGLNLLSKAANASLRLFFLSLQEPLDIFHEASVKASAGSENAAPEWDSHLGYFVK
jgi:metal-dependent hydrolase (beta-lactamase superfamily II)